MARPAPPEPTGGQRGAAAGEPKPARASQVTGHVFVDETKHRGYLLVAGVVVPDDLDSVRRTLRGLVLPGQRRLHMKAENDQRRRSVATAIAVSGVKATI
jgi:hypothetical protein